MKRRPAQSVNRSERTDFQLLDAWRRLSPQRQQEIFDLVASEAAAREQIIPYQQILQDAQVRDEARSLAKAVSVDLADFAQVIDPSSYSSYFARSHRATLAKLARVQDSPDDGHAQIIVEVKVHDQLRIQHRLIAAPFAIHVMFGDITLERHGYSEMIRDRRVVSVPADGELIIHAGPGAWFTYVTHPLAAWIAAHH